MRLVQLHCHCACAWCNFTVIARDTPRESPSRAAFRRRARALSRGFPQGEHLKGGARSVRPWRPFASRREGEAARLLPSTDAGGRCITHRGGELAGRRVSTRGASWCHFTGFGAELDAAAGDARRGRGCAPGPSRPRHVHAARRDGARRGRRCTRRGLDGDTRSGASSREARDPHGEHMEEPRRRARGACATSHRGQREARRNAVAERERVHGRRILAGNARHRGRHGNGQESARDAGQHCGRAHRWHSRAGALP